MIALTILEHFSKSISGKKIVWLLGDILNELTVSEKVIIQNELSNIAQKYKLAILCSTRCIIDMYAEYNKCNFISIIEAITVDLYKDGHFLDDIEACYPDKSNNYEEDLLKYIEFRLMLYGNILKDGQYDEFVSLNPSTQKVIISLTEYFRD